MTRRRQISRSAAEGRTRVVLFLPTPGGMTGAPRRVLALARGLMAQRGFEVALVGDPEDTLTHEAAKQGVEIVVVRRGNLLSRTHGALLRATGWLRFCALVELVRYNYRLLRALRAYRPDVVWVRGSKGIAFASLAVLGLGGCPLVWDVDYELPSHGVIALLHTIGLWLSRRVVLQYSSAFEAIFGRRRLARYGGKARALIPGMDFERLRTYRATRLGEQAVRQHSRSFCILHIGSICERKNQRFSLRVLYELKQLQPDARVELLIVGDEYDSEYAAELRKDIVELGLGGDARLLGWREDVPELLVRADLVLLPSHDEGVPNVIQEAMYIGCPVMVSDAGGLPEIVENGRTGWVLSTSSARVWARRIHSLYLSPKQLHAVAREASAAAERFSLQNWCREYGQLLRESTSRLRGSSGASR